MMRTLTFAYKISSSGEGMRIDGTVLKIRLLFKQTNKQSISYLPSTRNSNYFRLVPEHWYFKKPPQVFYRGDFCV